MGASPKTQIGISCSRTLFAAYSALVEKGQSQRKTMPLFKGKEVLGSSQNQTHENVNGRTTWFVKQIYLAQDLTELLIH